MHIFLHALKTHIKVILIKEVKTKGKYLRTEMSEDDCWSIWEVERGLWAISHTSNSFSCTDKTLVARSYDDVKHILKT